jgi:hypothetical protein
MAELSTPEEPEDLGNPEHVQERNREVKLRRREEFEDLKVVLSTGPGRRWMWNFISGLGPFRTPFGVDPHMSYFNGGRQNVALALIAEINAASPQTYALMQKENADG